MHSTNAFMNRTGALAGGHPADDLVMLNTLRAAANPKTAKDKERQQVDNEQQSDTVSKPGGFKNDPDDPTNPNEVRHRSIEKVDQQSND